jgi:hypothetical protein
VTAENDAARYRLDEWVLIPGTPIFGCPECFDPWESEPTCEHFLSDDKADALTPTIAAIVASRVFPPAKGQA